MPEHTIPNPLIPDPWTKLRRHTTARVALGRAGAFAHRTWVDRMPLLRNADGIEYDKSKIVLYAYRHIVRA